MPISHGKKPNGNASILKAAANGEKGINIAIAIITDVSATTGAVAQLCINGILRVRIMCTIKVCESKLSTNQPV
jgi:hypothetical protein